MVEENKNAATVSKKKTQRATAKKAVSKKRAPKKNATDNSKRAKLARALGIGARTVSKLRATAGAPAGSGLVTWKKFLATRAAETNDAQSIGNLPEELQRLRARLLRAQAGREEAVKKLRELELKEKQLDLVPLGDAKEAVRKILAPLRGLLDSLPRAVALQANPSDPEQAEEAVAAGLYKMLEMLNAELTKK